MEKLAAAQDTHGRLGAQAEARMRPNLIEPRDMHWLKIPKDL
jgi:hypothetical protein